ncbi:MAG: hypothetical protein ABIQ73_26565 [Acidimicrobiales bacterium]
MIKQADVSACAEQLRRVLEEIDAGRLDASPVQIAYMRGAFETLDALEEPGGRSAARATKPAKRARNNPRPN